MDQVDLLRDILVHTGETRKAISGLEESVKDIKQCVTKLSDTSVTQSYCQHTHQVLQTQIAAENQKVNTAVEVLKNDMILAKTSKGAKYWLGIAVALIALCTFAGGLGLSLIRIGQQWADVNKALQQIDKTAPYDPNTDDLLGHFK